MSREGTKSGVMVRVSAKRQARIGEVERLEARLRSAKSLILTEYRGLTVAEITELRRGPRGGSGGEPGGKTSPRPGGAGPWGAGGLAPLLGGAPGGVLPPRGAGGASKHPDRPGVAGGE